jgi:hypothetical protein
MGSDAAVAGCRERARGGGEAADFYYLDSLMSTLFTSTFIREGLGVADVYVLCVEEFRSVGILPPGGSSMFRRLPPGIFQELLFA